MKLSRFWVFLLLFAIAIPMFVFSQSNSGWNTQTTTATFGFGSQKFNSQLASVFKVQVPFPVYVSGKITMVVAPWWLLVLVFMIFYPIIDIITGFVPPFSKAAEMGNKGVERSKTVFTIGFSLLAMFVTPLVPYVVQLVTVGTTFGVWWFWMLLFMMFIWGVNWLFGESAFGDPFRKGAAGLGHIGNAGMTKFKKHFRGEMNDTTNEDRYRSDIDNVMNQLHDNIDVKEREIIRDLLRLFNILVQAKNQNSVHARTVLNAMLGRLKELKHFLTYEDELEKKLTAISTELASINAKASKWITSLKDVNQKIRELVSKSVDYTSVKYNKNMDVPKELTSFNTLMKRTVKDLDNKSIDDYIQLIFKELQADNVIDSDQRRIEQKITEIQLVSRGASGKSHKIVAELISAIEKIISGVVSPARVQKFIKFAGPKINDLERIDTFDHQLLLQVENLQQGYNSYLQKEKVHNYKIKNKIAKLDAVYNSMVANVRSSRNPFDGL